MRREIKELLGLTFGTIALVVIVTEFRGFAGAMSALASGYRTVVGSFIRPVG
jgi:hypothetical protein